MFPKGSSIVKTKRLSIVTTGLDFGKLG